MGMRPAKRTRRATREKRAEALRACRLNFVTRWKIITKPSRKGRSDPSIDCAQFVPDRDARANARAGTFPGRKRFCKFRCRSHLRQRVELPGEDADVGWHVAG